MAKTFNEIIRIIFSTEGNRTFKSLNERKKYILVSFFIYFIIAVSLTFIGTALVKSDYSILPADISMLAICIFLLVLLKTWNLLSEVIVAFVVFLCAISTVFTLTGGMEETGIISSLFVPIPLILLLGKRKGLWGLIAFFSVNVAGYILFDKKPWFPNYDPSWIGRICVTFIVISLMAYANEYVFDQLYLRLEKVTDSLKESQEKYKNMAVNKEKFLSIVSHDLNDTMTSFSVATNNLKESFDSLNELEKKDLLDQISASAEQNQKLLADLLKWSTVQNDSIPYSPQKVKIERIYRDIIKLFNPAIEEKKLSIFLKMKSNAEVVADPDMLSSILRNLVSNAIKFSETGGEVRIMATEYDDFMLVSVTDRGIGMNEKDLQKLKATVSFSNPGTLEETGAGVGLILVREFVHKNRGDFFIESNLHVGTEVSFTVPLAD